MTAQRDKKTEVETKERTRQAEQETQQGDFQKKVSVASSKIGNSLRSGAQKMARFTGRATKVSKLKVEIHNLENRVEHIQLEAGKRLWELHKENKLEGLDGAFDEKFEKIEDIQNQITAKKKQVESIPLIE